MSEERIDILVDYIKDIDKNEIIYSKEQEKDEDLRNANPYAINRMLYNIGKAVELQQKQIQKLKNIIKELRSPPKQAK